MQAPARSRPHAWVCCTTALLLEAAAVRAAWRGQLMAAAIGHGLSALLFGLATWSDATVGRVTLAATVASWALCVPVLGPLGLCGVLLPAFQRLRARRVDGVVEIELSPPNLARPLLQQRLPISEQFEGAAGESERVSALMVLRSYDPARAVPLFRAGLLDEHEDVRLLAFALLERREKELRAGIERDVRRLSQLTAADDNPRRAVVLEALCVAHWSLWRAGLVSGESAASTLRSALEYGERALALREQAALAVLLARISLRASQPGRALAFVNAAAALGTAHSVLAPLYAELAFAQGSYAMVERFLATASSARHVHPEYRRLHDFWSGLDRA